jgi:hypothetical protein
MAPKEEQEGVVVHLRAMFSLWPGVKESKQWGLVAFLRDGKPFLLCKPDSVVLNCLHKQRYEIAVTKHQGVKFSYKSKVREFWCEIPANDKDDIRSILYLIREVTDSLN